MKNWIVAGFAALGLGLAAIPFIPMGSALGTETVEAETAAGASCEGTPQPAKDFTLKDVAGKDVKLSDLKGKVVVLNFWATWCGPCKVEIPAFVELQDKYRGQGVVFLGLSVDDPVEKLKPFVDQYKINYPILLGDGHDDVQEAFGPIYGIPVTILIGRDGKICRRHMGIAAKEQVERDIKGML
ncbi:MAG: TlpA disulfide reductase family protein [Vicinamibacterales bacterium]